MPGPGGLPDGGGGGGGGAGASGTAAVGDPGPDPAPAPAPEPDDAAAALRLALDQLSALGLGAAGSADEESAPVGEDEAVAGSEPAPPDGPEPGVPAAGAVAEVPAVPPEPDVSPSPPPPPPPPRPSPPDVFAGFAPHPAALGPPTLLADQMCVIGSRKKSVNMTECVPVPSSEHVAEIVGRQGCKIKALRAKTNTYIKTPVRGEEPVFIVTGRKEDVDMAKREILSAAEHFSLIRATRGKAGCPPGAAPGPPNLPGQTTIQVRVPYRVVGLVVGPKGATIKRIQQRTHTYIVTPGRDKEPVFAVTGMPENVDRAREEIEAHITLRTGAFPDAGPDSDFHANGTDVCLDLLGAAASLWTKAPHPARRPPAAPSSLRSDSALGAPGGPEAFYAGSRGGPPGPDPGPASPYGGSGGASSSSGNGAFTFGGDGPGAPTGTAAPDDGDFGFDFLALDLTVPAAATIWAPFERAAPLPAFGTCCAVNGAPAPAPGGARRSSGAGSPRHSPTLQEPGLGLELPLTRRPAPDPVGALPWRAAPQTSLPFPGGNSSSSSTGAGGTGFPAAASLPTSAPLDSPESKTIPTAANTTSSSTPSSAATAVGTAVPATVSPAAATPAPARECVVCAEGEVMAALVPCGHNLFCMDCAMRICGKSAPECPACRTPATQAIHIFS
ncbi:RNA-binding protein MEX3D [Ochotona curzoniae]|uniref:RNA-binding protein MEX3D n=1 Tax=Ochotona curzoniae TaxID=130825 RepID=UPI001B353C65|nr:RNA-binding protein MEX3D [Ochotona curzoniae]